MSKRSPAQSTLNGMRINAMIIEHDECPSGAVLQFQDSVHYWGSCRSRTDRLRRISRWMSQLLPDSCNFAALPNVDYYVWQKRFCCHSFSTPTGDSARCPIRGCFERSRDTAPLPYTRESAIPGERTIGRLREAEDLWALWVMDAATPRANRSSEASCESPRKGR